MNDQPFVLVPAADLSAVHQELAALRREIQQIAGKRSDWHKIKDAAKQLGVSVSTITMKEASP